MVQYEPYTGGPGDPLPPQGGLVDADRQVGGAGGQHREDGRDLLGPLGQRDGHQVSGADPLGPQLGGETQRPLGQLTVGERAVLAPEQRRCPGVGGGVGEEAVVQACGGPCRRCVVDVRADQELASRE